MNGSNGTRRLLEKTVCQGHSEQRGESYFGPYVEHLNDARTMPGKKRVLARRGRAVRRATVSASCKRRDMMFRHPHYLEVPWDMHGQRETTGSHRHLWWLIALLVLLAMFLIGVGVTHGIL